MAVSFNAIHIILIQRHLKTFEKERNCNRNRSTLQKGWRMVKPETRRDAEILVRNPSPRLFGEKFRDSKKVKTNHEKTRLRDLSKMLTRFRDPSKIFRDPRFSRYHSPPLPEMYKNTIFRAYAYQPVGNRESWERKPTKHFGNQNYDAEKSEKILRSKVELQSLQHYNSSPLCAIAFSGLVLSLSPTGGRSWVRKKNSLWI